jgi:leader peptidase (prepilin peptidase)/N-methyltransferase
LALAITDVDAFRIVDRLNLRGTLLLVGLLGVAALADGTEDALIRGLLGGAAYFLATNLIFLVARGQGFGYGDVKLSVLLGVFTAYISWGALGWSVFITALFGGLLSIVVLAAGLVSRSRAKRAGGPESTIREAMRAELPYGPAMIMGSWSAIILAGLGAFPIPT